MPPNWGDATSRPSATEKIKTVVETAVIPFQPPGTGSLKDPCAQDILMQTFDFYDSLLEEAASQLPGKGKWSVFRVPGLL